jgi:hypothetical protein
MVMKRRQQQLTNAHGVEMKVFALNSNISR